MSKNSDNFNSITNTVIWLFLIKAYLLFIIYVTYHKAMRIFCNIFVVMWQDTLHKDIFLFGLGLYHIPPIMWIKEKLAWFTIRDELNEVVIATYWQHEVGEI